MYRLRILISLSVLLLLLSSCENCDDQDFVQEGVTTKVIGETVVIENNHEKPISYFAIEYETDQLTNWAARSGPENTIANGSSKVVLWEEIMSDGSPQREDRIIIYWWVAESEFITSAVMNQNIVVL